MLLVNRRSFERAIAGLCAPYDCKPLLEELDHNFCGGLKYLGNLLELHRNAGRVASKLHLAHMIVYAFSGSGNMFRHALETSDNKPEVVEASLHFAYEVVFARHCAPVLRNGATDYSPLEDVCYAMWDLPCGVTSCFYVDSSDSEDKAFEWLARLLNIEHVLIQESAIHALGLLMHLHPERCRCLLQSVAPRLGRGHPLSDYASAAMSGLL